MKQNSLMIIPIQRKPEAQRASAFFSMSQTLERTRSNLENPLPLFSNLVFQAIYIPFIVQ